MIEVFEGRIGGGKTLSAMQRMMSYWGLGGLVFTNVDVNWEACKGYARRRYGIDLDDRQLTILDNDSIPRFWERVPRGTRARPVLCIIDEADVWLGNKTSGVKIDTDIFNFLKQSRKLGMDVIFITQSLPNLSSQIQRLCQYIWRFKDMRRLGIQSLKLLWPFPQILQSQFDYDGKTLLSRKLWWLDVDLFPCYNTNALYCDFTTLAAEKAAEYEGIQVRKVGGGTEKQIPEWAYTAAAGFLVIALLV